MHKLSITALAGVLALTTSGSERDRTIQPSPTAFSLKRPDLASSQKTATLVSNSQKPVLPPPGLIQSTNIDQRLKQVHLGRSDPFTGVFPQIEVVPKPQKLFPDLPELTTVKAVPAPTKPKPPNTDLAKGVAVEGVVQTENESHAIIKLPQDSTSRYVSEGQQLPGGELSLKRIEFPEDSDPLVVLEQNGIEVAKAVGDPASSQTDESTDIASSTGAPGDSLGNSFASNSLASEPADSEEMDESTDTVASSQGAQNSDSETGNSLTSNSDTNDSFASDEKAAEADEVTQPIEKYTAAIPVPSPPPSPSLSTKKPREKVAVPPAPTNYKPSVPSLEIASGMEEYPSETDSSYEDSVRSAQASSDRAGQDLVEPRQYASSEAGSDFQPHTANANALNPTDRQQLIERLRQSSTAPVGNSIESNLQATDGANVEVNQQSMDLRYKKPLPSEIPTIRDTKVMKLLSHRQELINQLRNSQALSTSP